MPTEEKHEANATEEDSDYDSEGDTCDASRFQNLVELVGAVINNRLDHPSAEKPLASYVINRHGDHIPVRFDIVTERIEDLRSNPAYGPELTAIDSVTITAEVIKRFSNGMRTRDLDVETVATCIERAPEHPDYDALAARICVSDLHKRTPDSHLAAVESIMSAAADERSVRYSPEYVAIVKRASQLIDKKIDYNRDYRFRYFGLITSLRAYMMRAKPRAEESPLQDVDTTERPQDSYMRVALQLYVGMPDKQGHLAPEAVFNERLKKAFQHYDMTSLQIISHASPTVLNSGTKSTQLSSCFQTSFPDDMEGQYSTLKKISVISKWSGGVSGWVHGIRAEGATIRGTNGRSSGVVRFLRVVNDTQLYSNQGGNRPGAFNITIMVEHDDIFSVLEAARIKGDSASRQTNAPDLKYALWVNDYYFEVLKAQIENIKSVAAGGEDDPKAGDWYLFDPDESPGLHLVCGAEYRALHARYVAEGKFRRCVKAGDIMLEAFKTWSMGGTPYVMNKDQINLKSNMTNVAPICSSNLCCEVTIPSWSKFDKHEFGKFHPGNELGGEFGVCNLDAVILEQFVTPPKAGNGPESGYLSRVNFAGIAEAAGLSTRALNRIIDLNFSPSKECRRSNLRHRPVGVGVMGLADLLAHLRIAWGSRKACLVSRGVSAAIYFGAMSESAALAEVEGPYETFEGSPASQGTLQPDLWVKSGHLDPNWEHEVEVATAGFLKPADWRGLRERCRRGVRNAYVTAYMPTATTSNIVGVNECFEPYTSNVYTRKTLAGDFFIVKRHLLYELMGLGLWDKKMHLDILAAKGSVQNISRIPLEVRKRHLTARETHQSRFIWMAKAMAPFVCQSMSMNYFGTTPSLPKLLRFFFEGQEAGLKTLMYYAHSQPATAGSAPKATEPEASPSEQAPVTFAEVILGERKKEEALMCSILNREGCTACAL